MSGTGDNITKSSEIAPLAIGEKGEFVPPSEAKVSLGMGLEDTVRGEVGAPNNRKLKFGTAPLCERVSRGTASLLKRVSRSFGTTSLWKCVSREIGTASLCKRVSRRILPLKRVSHLRGTTSWEEFQYVKNDLAPSFLHGGPGSVFIACLITLTNVLKVSNEELLKMISNLQDKMLEMKKDRSHRRKISRCAPTSFIKPVTSLETNL